MSNPRKHHFCPESYLMSFTEEGTRKGTLYVFDKLKNQRRKSKPKNEAHQRDFYKVELEDGSDPFFLEKELSKIEGKARLAIEFILKEHKLPDIRRMAFLLTFVGLLAVRIPIYRKKFSDFSENFVKTIMRVACAEERRFEALKKNCLAESGRDVADINFNDMREFIEGDQYTVETHQNAHLVGMVQLADEIIKKGLLPRNWGVIVADGGEFVCSDNPVGLNWRTPPLGPWQSPGFERLETEVTIPLSKGVALIGCFESLDYGAFSLNKAGVATLNNKTIQRAERYVYGPRDDFIWRDEHGTICNASKYFEAHGVQGK